MTENIINDIWLDLTIFDKLNLGFIGNVNKITGLDAAYRIWEEANNTIENSNGNQEKLNQGFLSLKRAFNVTSKELKKNLGIDQIKYNGKKKKNDFLADLEYFEIIKTLNISRYLKIRNMIEHENSNPPSKEECLYLSEYIWNYIRNAINVLMHFSEFLIFTPSNYHDECRVSFDYIIEENKNTYYPHLYVKGFVDLNYISFCYKENSMKISNIQLLNKDDLERLEEFKQSSAIINNLNKIPFRGEVLDQDAIANLIKFLILPEYGGLDEYTFKTIFWILSVY